MSVTILDDEAAAVVGTVSVTDDGDHLSPSGLGTAIHTIAAATSTGPYTVVLITWSDAAAQTLSSLTWNGNAMTILVQDTEATDSIGAAIAIISGAQSGSIVATFSGAVDASGLTVVSLNNLSSTTPIDTDSDTDGGGAASLAALDSPGADGVRLCAYANGQSPNAITWTNATELADSAVLGSGYNYRHSAGYDAGADATAITANSSVGTNPEAIVGVSLR
jgi:hypothetical protein